jgi:hypothetical protein
MSVLPFMILIRVLLFFLFVLGVCPGTSAAEDAQKAGDAMLERARQLSDIRSPNAPAFRLNVSFSFIGPDLETVQGTYTEVWISNSQWRRETVVGDLRRIEVGGPTKLWLLDSGKDNFPERAAEVSTAMNVFPARGAEFEFESITEPDAITQCYVTKAKGQKRQRHALCFDKQNNVLVENITPQLVGDRVADYSCDYEKFLKFGVYFFPREVACSKDRHQIMQAKVVELSSEPPSDAAFFNPPTGALEMGNCPVDTVPPHTVTAVDPQYPFGARD